MEAQKCKFMPPVFDLCCVVEKGGKQSRVKWCKYQNTQVSQHTSPNFLTSGHGSPGAVNTAASSSMALACLSVLRKDTGIQVSCLTLLLLHQWINLINYTLEEKPRLTNWKVHKLPNYFPLSNKVYLILSFIHIILYENKFILCTCTYVNLSIYKNLMVIQNNTRSFPTAPTYKPLTVMHKTKQSTEYSLLSTLP